MVTIDGVISGVTVNHRDADVETIAMATEPAERDVLSFFLADEQVSEAFVLFTCNRAEYYVVTDSPQHGARLLSEYLSHVPDRAIQSLQHEAAIAHLMRVAAGLESQVLGEDEIIGQFKDAFQTAARAEALGPVLEQVLLKAIHLAERARTETAINEGIVSLARAAVEQAAQTVDLHRSTALVIGAGNIGTRAAHALEDCEVEQLYIANRTRSKADALAETLTTAEAIDVTALEDALARADLCITATDSPGYILSNERVSIEAETTVIDLGQPPDVAPAIRGADVVDYYDLDRLSAVTEQTHTRRREAADAVEEMIQTEIENLQCQFKRTQAESVIAAMREGACRIKEDEIRRAQTRLEEGEAEPADIIQDMADALVNKLMAEPTEALRHAAENDDWTTIFTAIHMFEPDVDVDELPDDICDPLASEPGD